MTYYVYILESEINGDFYKGVTENVKQRLFQHNDGQSRYTSALRPWKLVYAREFKDKRSALIEERRLKRLNRASLLKIISG